MNIGIIGDVNNYANYHIGDEAMLLANIDKITELIPDVNFTIISESPEWSSNHYGCKSLSFKDFIEKINEHDLIHISGGGNLCSYWPEHIDKRVNLITTAHKLNKPIIVTGQTIGELHEHHNHLLVDAFKKVKYLGLREENSYNWAKSHGLDSNLQLDDCFYLQPGKESFFINDVIDKSKGRKIVLITLIPHCLNYTDSIITQLQKLVDKFNLFFVFVPHVNSEENDISDSRYLDYIKEKIGDKDWYCSIHVLWPEHLKLLTNHSYCVISTRYHPLVFSLSSGIPCLGFYINEYTKNKTEGILRHGDLINLSFSFENIVLNLYDIFTDFHNKYDIYKDILKSKKSDWQLIYSTHWEALYSIIQQQKR